MYILEIDQNSKHLYDTGFRVELESLVFICFKNAHYPAWPYYR